MHRTISITASLLLAGCSATWTKADLAAPAQLDRRQHVEVWQGTEARVWHAVELGPGDISGVPYHQSPDCDSCRVSLNRATVDSLRVGNRMSGVYRTTGLIAGIVGLYALVMSGWDSE